MNVKSHWENVYETKPPDSVSWFQQHAERSLDLIRQSGIPVCGRVIDIGGGASTLVDGLLAQHYEQLTVLDLSGAALAAARHRLGPLAEKVHWIEADITRHELPENGFDLWHDRAVFHFLTEPAARAAYVGSVLRAVKPGGYVIVATFADDGPTRCSGLPVARYRPDELHAEFGERFTLLRHEKESHLTPTGAVQSFLYCFCRRNETAGLLRKSPRAN
jgi:SAM-dependent methyltransferase